MWPNGKRRAWPAGMPGQNVPFAARPPRRCHRACHRNMFAQVLMYNLCEFVCFYACVCVLVSVFMCVFVTAGVANTTRSNRSTATQTCLPA